MCLIKNLCFNEWDVRSAFLLIVLFQITFASSLLFISWYIVDFLALVDVFSIALISFFDCLASFGVIIISEDFFKWVEGAKYEIHPTRFLESCPCGDSLLGDMIEFFGCICQTNSCFFEICPYISPKKINQPFGNHLSKNCLSDSFGAASRHLKMYLERERETSLQIFLLSNFFGAHLPTYVWRCLWVGVFLL